MKFLAVVLFISLLAVSAFAKPFKFGGLRVHGGIGGIYSHRDLGGYGHGSYGHGSYGHGSYAHGSYGHGTYGHGNYGHGHGGYRHH